jgi:hypothetical protein
MKTYLFLINSKKYEIIILFYIIINMQRSFKKLKINLIKSDQYEFWKFDKYLAKKK